MTSDLVDETAPEGPVKPRPRRAQKVFAVLGAVVLAGCLAGGAVWWSADNAARQRAADAQASAQASAEASAKEEADKSAAFWASVAADNQSRYAQESADAAAFNDSQESEQAADVEHQLAAQGWKHYGGDLYYQYEDHSHFTCGSFRCTYIHVTSIAPGGCPGGLYVAASVELGNSSIGLANGFTAPLSQGKDAIVKLEDTTNQGDSFQLKTLSCH